MCRNVKKTEDMFFHNKPNQFLNQGSCLHQSTHEKKGVENKHVCNHCFTKNWKTSPNPEMECKTKLKNTKKRINLDVRQFPLCYKKVRYFVTPIIHSKILWPVLMQIQNRHFIGFILLKLSLTQGIIGLRPNLLKPKHKFGQTVTIFLHLGFPHHHCQ